MSFDVTQALVDFLRRWGELSPSSAAVLALVFIAGGLVPVPRTFLSLAAGVVFGMAAMPMIMPSTTLGSLIAFLLARYLFAARLWRWVERKPKALAIMNAVNAEGWRIVALCRLASPIPSTIQNAIFGLTRIGCGRISGRPSCSRSRRSSSTSISARSERRRCSARAAA